MPYVYTVEEVNVPADYEASYSADGLTVTNTYVPPKIDIPVSKTWNDGNNQDGIRPDSITVRLFADGVEVDSRVVTAADGWKTTFTGLDKTKADGTDIVYTVNEDEVPGYPSVAVAIDDQYRFTIGNGRTLDKVSVPVTKVWNDADNKAGKRPESVTIELVADGETTGQTVELNADNGWKATFTDLDKNKASNPIAYTVKEHTVDGYTVKVTGDQDAGFTVTNSYVPKKPAKPTNLPRTGGSGRIR